MVNSNLFFLPSLFGLFLLSCGNPSQSEQQSIPTQVQYANSFALANSVWNSAWSNQNRLQIAIHSIPSNLNPFANITSTGQAIQRQLHGFLWKTNPLTGMPEADLCSSLSALPKQKNTRQLILHQNRFFDAPNPDSRCTAADVIFSLKAFSLPGLANSSYQNTLQALKYVQQLNDSTLHLEFLGNDSALIYALTDIPILRESEWDPTASLRSLSHSPPGNSVAVLPELMKAVQKNSAGQGLGNYALADFQPSQLVRLCLKPSTSSAQNSPDTLDWIWLGDATGLENHLKFQRADVFPYLTHSDYMAFAKNPGISAHYHISAIQTQTISYFALNSKPFESGRHPAMEDPQVRLALAYLTPKQLLLSTVFDSSIKPIVGLGHLGPKNSKKNPDFQPEKAIALLKKAGWTDSDQDGILDKSIKGKSVRLSLKLLYNSASRISEDLISLLQGNWLKHGVVLEKKALVSSVFYTELQNRNYDIALISFSAKYSPAHLQELWHSQSWKNRGHNYTGFGSPQSDSLLMQLAEPVSSSRQEELLLALQELILEQTPWIPLHYSQRYMATHRRWHEVNVLSLPPGFMPEEFRLGN